MKQLSKYAFRIALIALVWIPIQASAQLTLDNFTSGTYVKRIINPNVHDLHYGAMPPNSPLGQARQTYFGAAPNPDGQWSTLDVGKGRLVVDAGFGCDANIEIDYGFNLAGGEVPLGLNLDGFTGLQLTFQGIATSEELLVVVTIFPQTGAYWNYEVVLPPDGNPFLVSFPFSGFRNGTGGGGLTQADLSNIDYVTILAEGGGFASFGLTSFQAINQ
jgi:hypothetical protein